MHALLRNGLKHAETCLVALTQAGRIMAIDETGAGWLGTEPEALIGQGPWMFGGLVREAEWPATWARLVDEGQLMLEGSIVDADGRVVRLALQLNHVPTDGDQPAHAFVMAMRRVESDARTAAGPLFSRLHHAAAFIDDPLFDWDVVSDELTFNPPAAALLGVEPGTRLSGHAARMVFPAESADLAPRFAELIAGKRDQMSFMRSVNHHGTAGDCLVRVRVAARAPDGRARRVVIHLVDVTELNRAKAEAREKEELFSAVAHTATAAILILNTDGAIAFANARAEEVLGLSRSEMTGRSHDAPEWQTTAPDGSPWPDELLPFNQVQSTGRPVNGVELAIRWPDGRRRQLSVSCEPLRNDDGELQRVLFAVDDITERYEAAERLARSERRLRDVLDRLSVGVHLVDSEGRTILWNRAAEEQMLRAETGPAKGTRLSERRQWTLSNDEGRQLPLDEHPLAVALRTGEAQEDAVLAVGIGGGSPVAWVRVSAIPRVDEAGRVVDVVTQVIDVTERRQLEERLRESRRLEALGRLAGGVAHDFNNLLTIVLAEADVLSSSLALADPLQAEVESIRLASTRGAALVRALLGFARRQFRHPRELQVGTLVGGASRRWERRSPQTISLDMAVDEGLPTIVLDPEQFDQVFEALLDNARDAMQGVGRVRVRVDGVELAPVARESERPDWPGMPAGDYLRVRVVDRGPGVPGEAVHRIFEPFFSTATRGLRAGLGLANAHGILRQNGGDIRLAANSADGATFEILWPSMPVTET